MSRSRVKVRKMSKVAASVEDVLTKNEKQTNLVRGHCLKLLKLCEDGGIEPEVLLFELYASIDCGKEFLRLKHTKKIAGEFEDDLTEDEVAKLEEDLSKVLKCIKTEMHALMQSTEETIEKGAGKPKEQRQRNNEEQEYVPSQERPHYIW